MINFDSGRLSIRVRCTLKWDQGKEGLGALGGWGTGLAGGLGGWGAGGLGGWGAGGPKLFKWSKKIVLPGLF